MGAPWLVEVRSRVERQASWGPHCTGEVGIPVLAVSAGFLPSTSSCAYTGTPKQRQAYCGAAGEITPFGHLQKVHENANYEKRKN